MTDDQKKLAELEKRLQDLMRKHASFGREIMSVQDDIRQLNMDSNRSMQPEVPAVPEDTISKVSLGEVTELPNRNQEQEVLIEVSASKTQGKSLKDRMSLGIDLEKFIGENLINKIGIVITILGVGIGAKYAIDHNLISPLTRIILGYLVGAGLLGFAIRLKRNYEGFSAVLLSGAMAIFYFITYAAFSFYGLIPQIPTFALMVVFTAFTVVAAINYKRQVIAVLGLVGAYAIPFLLGGDPDQAATLFMYVIVINIGILAVSFRFYWKLLYYASFLVSWMIYFQWMIWEYQSLDQTTLALLVNGAFFIIFYATFLTYKLLQGEQFKIKDIFLLLLNSFFFYGIGYSLLSDYSGGKQLLGLFTLGNAAVHFVVSWIIYRQQLADRNLFYFITGLVLVFITISIPVQLDGHWVTLLWITEATLLFWIGRTKNIAVYEKLAYPLIGIAFISLAQDWSIAYDYHPEFSEASITPLFNVHFLTSIIGMAGFGFMSYLVQNDSYPTPKSKHQWIADMASYLIPALFLVILFASFSVEITSYWDHRYLDSAINTLNAEGAQERRIWNSDLKRMGMIWNVNFTFLFLIILSIVNIRKISNTALAYANVALNVLNIALFLLIGLMILSELRVSFLENSFGEYYRRSNFNLIIRYISFALVGGMLWTCKAYVQSGLLKRNYALPFDLLLHISLLTMASFELVHWMDIAGSTQSDKLGLSILWGLYSLGLIALGIWKSKRHLRIGAIILFGITLVKLFFYDISDLNTIAKTIVFVSLGILLLIISFLYNKYGKNIFGEHEK